MAKTFDQWMADNGMSTGSGPNFVYGRPAYNQAQGSSGDRSTAVLNWQREQGTDYLNQILGGGGSASAGGANPFGAPTMNTGNRFEAGLTDAEMRLKSLLDDPDSIKQTGAYKFRVKQGEDALQRQMGARGMLNSGNRLMELTKYGQDMASQEYDAQAGRIGSLLGNYSTNWNANNTANLQKAAADDRTRMSLAESWMNSGRLPSGGGSTSRSMSTSNLGMGVF